MVFPAKQHLAKTVSHLVASASAATPHHHILYLEGEITRARHDTDNELPFRQEGNFYYLSGFDSPGGHLLISVQTGKGNQYDVKSTLFIPPVNSEEVMWCGLPPLVNDVAKTHDVDAVKETPSLVQTLKQLISDANTTLHILPERRGGIPKDINVNINDGLLLKAVHEARTQKTEGELELMRHANKVSSEAHVQVMKAIANGASTEQECEAVFRASGVRVGVKSLAYLPIFAYGNQGATLHYVANDKDFDMKNGGMMVVDAAFEYHNYAADITRTIPAGNGGKFGDRQKSIYSIVLLMQKAAFAKIKVGVEWESIQLEMHRVAAKGLLDLGILQRGPSKAETDDELIEEIVQSYATVPFFPHGVGHLLGLDTHDAGGLPNGRATNLLYKNVRLRRPLLEGYVVTVEPGIYFNPLLIEGQKSNPYINHEETSKYVGIGGVRIEDNLVVTKDGYENLTSAPKEIEEIEALCSGKN